MTTDQPRITLTLTVSQPPGMSPEWVRDQVGNALGKTGFQHTHAEIQEQLTAGQASVTDSTPGTFGIYVAEDAVAREVYGVYTDMGKAKAVCQERAEAYFGPRTTRPLDWREDERFASAPHQDPGGTYLFTVTRYTVPLPQLLTARQASIMHAALAAWDRTSVAADPYDASVTAADIAAHLGNLLALLGHPVPGTDS